MQSVSISSNNDINKALITKLLLLILKFDATILFCWFVLFGSHTQLWSGATPGAALSNHSWRPGLATFKANDLLLCYHSSSVATIQLEQKTVFQKVSKIS